MPVLGEPAKRFPVVFKMLQLRRILTARAGALGHPWNAGAVFF